MSDRCDFCEEVGCTGRCHRTDLKRVVRRLRDENRRLSEGEAIMEKELDRLSRENREMKAGLISPSAMKEDSTWGYDG